jgi:hypothetical protein
MITTMDELLSYRCPADVAIELVYKQLRRAKWFDYACRRFDLVSFGELADWIARDPGSVTRNEERRKQALIDLEASVARGEFGPADERRCIPWFPKPPRIDTKCLQLNYGQIVGMKGFSGAVGVTPDLHVSRALCVKWLEARQISVPPWLSAPIIPTNRPAQQTVDEWLLDYFQKARRAGKSPPKRDLDAFPACRVEIGATVIQMRDAMKKIPSSLKRSRGSRDRRSNRTPDRTLLPAAR